MKLSVWRVDLLTRNVTFESDYRESVIPTMPSVAAGIDLFYDILSDESRELIDKGFHDLAEGRVEEFHGQDEMIFSNTGQHAWGELFATVDKRDAKGKPLTLVGTSMIINRQKEIEQELIEARQKAEESDRLKSAFLANMSHEIRTPLNAIVGFSNVLPMAQSDEERDELIELIKENNTQLVRLFEDMVYMSELEAGSMVVKKTHFEVNALLAELVDRYAVESEKKGLTLSMETRTESPVLYTDRPRLREILNQYLNNALKFTRQGSITVGYEVNQRLMRLWVRDTGIGIAPQYCNDTLFNRFFKVDDFAQGTGLGLSICRSLAQGLGGQVGVESKEGEGSLFWVEIAME